jgi:hypothetical protein
MNGFRIAALSMLLLATHSFAQSSRAERLQSQSKKLSTIERQLSPFDQENLDRHIAGIDRVLRDYERATGGATVSLTCLSNGQQGSYEKFTITDSSSGTPIGKSSALATCQQLLTVQNQSLICVSNGEAGSYEKFGVYDLGRKVQAGGMTNLKSCQRLVQSAKPAFVCQSNGQAGSYEKFKLYNRETDKVLGGETALEQCVSSIPN